MRAWALSIVVGLGAGACAPSAPRVDVGGLPPCETLEMADLAAQECRLDASGETLHVKFAPIAEGAPAGIVTVDVLGPDAVVVQTLNEGGVAHYMMPGVQDVDGDSHADLLIPRERGNVNTVMGVWIFSRERGRFERAGEVSGVEVTRTAEGYVAVPARSSAAAWNVAFYRLDEAGLTALATVGVEATGVDADGQVQGTACAITDAPGLALLGTTLAEAEQKFCAEPAAQVFRP